MKHIITLIISACLIGACSSPPKPPQPSGEYRPINPVANDGSIAKRPKAVQDNSDVGVNIFGGAAK